MPPVFRFAPSPNGYLHLGHAYSALLNFDAARRSGGRLLLRIEDIDPARCRPEFEAAIYQDLAWLGISWETPVRRQSEHLADYRAALEKLTAMGLVYPAFESRAEIARLVAQREAQAPWPRDPDGAPLYPGAAKSLSPDRAGAPARFGRALCAAARHGGGVRAGPRSRLDRARRRSRWRDRRGGRPARSLGRRHPRAQGDADQLSSVGGDRRRLAGRHRGGAGRGPVLVDQRAPAAAASARSAAAGLPAPPPRARQRGAEAVEVIRRRPVFANSGRRVRRRPTSAAKSACLDKSACPDRPAWATGAMPNAFVTPRRSSMAW